MHLAEAAEPRNEPRAHEGFKSKRGSKIKFTERKNNREKQIYRGECFILHLAEAAEPRNEPRALEPRPRAPHVRRAQRPRPACRVVLSAGG